MLSLIISLVVGTIVLKQVEATKEGSFQIFVRTPPGSYPTQLALDLAPETSVSGLYQQLPLQYRNCPLRFGQNALIDRNALLSDIGVSSQAVLDLDPVSIETVTIPIRIQYVTVLKKYDVDDDAINCTIKLGVSLIPQLKECLSNNDDFAKFDIDLLTSKIRFGFRFNGCSNYYYGRNDRRLVRGNVKISPNPRYVDAENADDSDDSHHDHVEIDDNDTLMLVSKKNAERNDVRNHGIYIINQEVMDRISDIDYSDIHRDDHATAKNENSMLVLEHETIAKYPLRIIRKSAA